MKEAESYNRKALEGHIGSTCTGFTAEAPGATALGKAQCHMQDASHAWCFSVREHAA